MQSAHKRCTVRVALTVVCGLVLADAARAQPRNAAILARLHAVAAAQQQRTVAMQAVAAELNTVKVLLEKADHDYMGHRAAAVKEISVAIRILMPKRKRNGKAPGPVGEPQAVSDAQLRAAVGALGKVAAQLSSMPGKRSAKAVGHVGAAVKELEVALTIK
jgi:hypothetical protein